MVTDFAQIAISQVLQQAPELDDWVLDWQTITAADIVDLFSKYQLEPICGTYAVEDGGRVTHACAIGAMYLGQGINPLLIADANRLARVTESQLDDHVRRLDDFNTRFPEGFHQGVTLGFDHGKDSDLVLGHSGLIQVAPFKRGLELGCQVRSLVFSEE